jgi:hypothetical protein
MTGIVLSPLCESPDSSQGCQGPESKTIEEGLAMTDIMSEQDLYLHTHPTALEVAVTTLAEAVDLCDKMLGAVLIEDD